MISGYTHTQPEKGKGGRKRSIEIITRSRSKEKKRTVQRHSVERD